MRSWFRRPEGPIGLALLRISVTVIILVSPEIWSAPASAAIAARFRVVPEGLRWAVEHVPINPGVASAAQLTMFCGCVLGAIGLCSRFALGLVTVSGLYVLGLAQLGGMVLHDMHLLWFSALLSLSRCGDAFSVDRWLARRRGVAAPGPSLAYAVPLNGVRALLGVIYFFPGFWKLWTSGATWVLSDNLRNQMYVKWFEMNGFTPSLRIDQHPLLLRAGALAVVAFELSFIVLVWWPRARPWLAAAGLAFHISAELFMRIPFESLWGCYAVLFDWDALARRFDRHDARPTAERPARPREVMPAALLACALVAASTIQGARGMMQAFPFACYPTFQWLAGTRIPDLRIEAVFAHGVVVAVPDGPATGAPRSQKRWGTAWQVAGFFGTPPDRARLRQYWSLVRQDPRAFSAAHGARELRFYAVTYSVLPEQFGAPPLTRRLLGKLVLHGDEAAD
jgi:hypothetical protein